MRAGNVLYLLLLVVFLQQSALAASEGFVMSDVIGRGLFGLAVCLGTFSIIVYYLKSRYGGLKLEQSPIKILGRSNISNKTALVLAEVRGEEYLLAVGSESISLISGKLGKVEDKTDEPKLFSLAGGGE
jgi:flagellar biogenesis protein FliO